MVKTESTMGNGWGCKTRVPGEFGTRAAVTLTGTEQNTRSHTHTLTLTHTHTPCESQAPKPCQVNDRKVNQKKGVITYNMYDGWTANPVRVCVYACVCMQLQSILAAGLSLCTRQRTDRLQSKRYSLLAHYCILRQIDISSLK